MRAPLLIAVLLALCAAPAMAKPTADNGQLSWGKVGVSFEDYRDDAVQCTMLGTIAMLDETPSQQDLPVEVGGGTDGPILPDVHAYIASLRLQALQASLEARDARQVIVDQCLTDRGYRRFLLTRDQREHLRTLQHGSEERRRYLHSLAVDPNVLSTQGMDEP